MKIKVTSAKIEPWYFDIKQYMESQTFPLDATKNERQTIQRLTTQFIISRGVLYKKSPSHVLLRCLDEKQVVEIIMEVHNGVYGPHTNGHMLAKKIIRMGYYWSTMESECCKHVQRCHLCQIFTSKINAPLVELHNVTTPWPFSMWGIDVVGLIPRKASNGHQYIIVAIDYFTKWVESTSLAHVTMKNIARFILRDIICRYGVPNEIITDNGSRFDGNDVRVLYEKFQIKHHYSSPYCPQMNGAVEATNKNLERILKKMSEAYAHWYEMLSYALMAYRTSIRTSTGQCHIP